jgi:hypothetical protein
MAVERARMHQPGKDNLTWGTFVSDGVATFLGGAEKSATPAKTAAKAPAKKK